MFEDVLEIIKKAGIFLILSQTILQLCVSEIYEKYIKMMVVLVTAVMLILPIAEFIKEDAFQSYEEYRIEYEKKIFEQEVDFEKIRDERWEGYVQEYIGTDEQGE